MDRQRDAGGGHRKRWTGNLLYILLFLALFAAGFYALGPVKVAGNWIPRTFQTLSLMNRTITAEDVKQLNRMRDLQSLSLYNCTVEDAHFSVSELSLERCTVKEGAFAGASMPLTVFLAEDTTGIDSYAFLENCPRLESFTVTGSGLTDENRPDLSGSEVTYYQLSGNPQLTGTEWISPRARTVICADCGITSLAYLAEFTELETLVCDRCPLESFPGEFQSRKLAVLSLQDAGLTKLNCLRGLDALEDVNLSYNQLEDISDLSDSVGTLKWLDVSGNPLSKESLSLLGQMTGLRRLYVDDIALDSLEFAGNLSELRDLTAIHCGISDLSPLASLEKLERVRLAFNEISDVSALTQLPGLKKDDRDAYNPLVDLAGNQITDITSLLSMQTGILSLMDNPLDLYQAATADKIVMARQLLMDYADNLEFCSGFTRSNTTIFVCRVPEEKQEVLKKRLNGHTSYTVSSDVVIYDTREEVIKWGGIDYTRWKELLEE